MIEGQVPVRPLSINRAFQGKRFNTKAKKEYETACLAFLGKPERTIKGDVELELVFYLKHPKQSDASNYIKIAEDLLCKARFLKDDRQVVSIIARKEKADEEGWWFRIGEL